MHLLYVDESGDPNGWKNQSHFVLGAIAVHEGQILRLTRKMNEIQQKYFSSIRIPLDLHATNIQGARGHFDHLPPEKREQLLLDICDWIGKQKFPNLVSFATAIHISALSSEKEALEIAVEDLTSRFNIFLKRLYSKKLPGKGLLIIDQAHQERYRELIAEYQKGSKYGYLGNIVDIPYFAGAHDTRLLQLADACAYSVFRFYEKDDHRYFDKIFPSFDKVAPQEGPDGLKHFTNEECTCVACVWHNNR
ncbi:MAG: DUF3800 domain-containing protein [Candidatus Bathyarchaeota archaeon]|nr:DUF3800 domain-containing protein [Candidatus Bathyarchaeota archaeon]